MVDYEKITCPNCENGYDGNYGFCPYCGQANKKLNLSFKYFVSEFLSANFNLDSKIFRTLKLLIISPAKLTTEFIAGKRTRYIPPMRLYLLLSFIYFLVLSIDSPNKPDRIRISKTEDAVTVSDSANDVKYLADDDDDEAITESDSLNAISRAIENRSNQLNTEFGKARFKQMFRQYTSIGMFLVMYGFLFMLFFTIILGISYLGL